MMSMTGFAISRALCRGFTRSTSGSFVDKAKNPPLHRPHEVAESRAGLGLLGRIRRLGHSLFSTLGGAKAFRDHSFYRRRSNALPAGGDKSVLGRSGLTPCDRFVGPLWLTTKLLQRFRNTRPSGGGDCLCHWKKSEQ